MYNIINMQHTDLFGYSDLNESYLVHSIIGLTMTVWIYLLTYFEFTSTFAPKCKEFILHKLPPSTHK